jgi:choice-of-anchor C domain-containing protein
MRFTSVAAAALFLAASSAGAQIVTNGSFETPTAPPGSFSNQSGTSLTGWTISVGNVDLIDNGFWQAFAGSQSIDMNGSAPATLYQDIALTPGQTYRLGFAMAENFFGGPATKTMDVSIGSISAGSYSFDNPAATTTNMGWQTHTFDFVANAPTMRLQFASTTSNCCWGPALDDVSVIQLSRVAAPEPASIALFGTGLVGLVMWRRRRA